MSTREKLTKRASKAGLSLQPDVIDALYAYFELLRKWNRKVSLTSLPVEDVGDEAIDRLLIEPVLATRYFQVSSASVLDIGSGGGSPAIPLKLAAPGVSLRMVESKLRKAAFLREVVRTLDVDRTTVDAVRFEELLARPTLHEAMDVVTIRAVKVDRKTLSELQSFVKPGGFLFLFGTASPTLPALAAPHLSPEASHGLLSQWGSRLEIFKKL
ncbi:MAG TPA: RsmG family class I SAM-dependent methyltransferase [Vicinamibacterales bacterium]|nr:RsmG family class I SAM-dependent methyltransferase [Vicinamibacterales bacterium]